MKHILNIAVLSALVLTGCGDDYVDKFDGTIAEEFTSATSSQYTLTSSDYSSIASNSTNKALADSAGLTDELASVGTNKYFNDNISADEYLPAFLKDLYYDAELGSTVTVTYNQYKETSSYLSEFTSFGSYTLSSDDYSSVWTGAVSASYLTPETESKIATILSSAVSDPAEGDAIVVSYAYDDVEPAQTEGASSSTGTTASYDTVYVATTTFDGAGRYVVAAEYEGSYYPWGRLSSDSYSYGYMSGTATTANADGNLEGVAYYAIDVEKATDGYTLMNALGQYIYLSGSYNSFNVKTSLDGSPYWTFTANEDGTFSIVNTEKEKTIMYSPSYGSFGAYPYDSSYDSYVFPSLFKEEISEGGTKAATEVQANKSALYRYDGSAWVEYSTDDVRLDVIQPATYATLGSETIDNEETFFPTYLALQLPYAEDGACVAVVYNTSSGYTISEFTYSDGTWAESADYTVETMDFSLDADGFSANLSIYQSSTLLNGDDGNFSTYDVLLPAGFTYIWSLTDNYGWKASAYKSSTNYEADSWIVSPAINLTKATAPYLSFDEVFRYVDASLAADYLTVNISTDFAGDITKATWTLLTIQEWASGSDWTFVNSGKIDLSDYIGNKGYIGFHYTSTISYAPTWEIKNFLVREPEEE